MSSIDAQDRSERCLNTCFSFYLEVQYRKSGEVFGWRVIRGDEDEASAESLTQGGCDGRNTTTKLSEELNIAFMTFADVVRALKPP